LQSVDVPVKALVTAFEPFGGDAVNASLEAVLRLPSHIGALQVVTAELPTSYERSHRALAAAIAREQPDLVLCVGQALDRAALCVERLAVNLQDTRNPDNDGACPAGEPVVPGGPAAYLSTLPVGALVAALRAENLQAQISMHAGTFVCNHVFYHLMHTAAASNHSFIGGFLHVPGLPKQTGNAEGLTLDDLVSAIKVVLETAAHATVAPLERGHHS
jgi:pyroglutamyl-peptidase